MKLLVCDVEGTIFKTKIRLPNTNLDSTIWQAIANELGAEAIEAEIETHRKWESGLYANYLEWMLDTIQIHKKYGLNKIKFFDIINHAEYNEGVLDFFSWLNRDRVIPVLISGGFQNLSERAQKDLGIYHSFTACEYFFDSEGLLASYNLLPCDFYGKVSFIEILLNEYKVSDKDWIFVGDGRNDIELAKKASLSFGFNPHPDLAKNVNHIIYDFRSLKSFLK